MIGLRVTIVDIAWDLLKNEALLLVLLDRSFGLEWRVEWCLTKDGGGCIIFIILTIIIKLRNFRNILIVLAVLINSLLIAVKNLLAKLNLLTDMTVYIDVHV